MGRVIRVWILRGSTCAEGMGCGRRWVRWVLRGTGIASGHPGVPWKISPTMRWLSQPAVCSNLNNLTPCSRIKWLDYAVIHLRLKGMYTVWALSIFSMHFRRSVRSSDYFTCVYASFYETLLYFLIVLLIVSAYSSCDWSKAWVTASCCVGLKKSI